MAWHAGGVCLHCVTRQRRYAAAVGRRSLAHAGTVIHGTVIHDSVVKANVPSGPAANGRASITASMLTGP
jgi:hypothetical protein